MINQDVGRSSLKRVGREAEGATHDPGARVARGEHIDIRVPDKDGFRGRDASLLHQRDEAERVRLLRMEAIAPINLKEKRAESQRIAYRSRGPDGLVSKHRHAESLMSARLHSR